VDRVTNKLAKIVTLEARSAIADNSAMRVAFFTTIGIRASIDHLQQNSKCVMFFVRHSCMTTVTLTNVSNYADAKPREGRGFSKPDVINHSFRYVSPYLWNQLPWGQCKCVYNYWRPTNDRPLISKISHDDISAQGVIRATSCLVL